MIFLQLLACAGMITGFFLLLGLKPVEFTDAIFNRLLARPKGIKSAINEATRRKKPSIFRREITEAQAVLEMTGRGGRFSMVCAAALLFFAVGAAVAAMLGNPFLVPVLAVGFLFLPFWYIKLSAHHYKKDIAAELETALSIITTAYLRGEDLLTAVEENVHYLNPPAQQVFREFVSQVKLVNPDVEAALRTMRGRIDNTVFQEWCDAMTACLHDRSLKTTLTPIVSKLSDMRNVNAELEYLITEPRKEFIIMVIFVLGNIPLMYMLNKDWYELLMHTPLGQIILAITAAVIFVSTAIVIKLTKPIEYRR